MPRGCMDSDCDGPRRLEPFDHQVGGHSGMLRLDDGTVCKPLVSREHNFYETMPAAMAEFTPEYRGVITVSFHEEGNGDFIAIAYPDKCSVFPQTASEMSSASSSSSNLNSDCDQPTPSRTVSMLPGASKKSAEEDLEVVSTAGNTWNQRLVRQHLKSKAGSTHKFILLENLASHYKVPCVLDLKMGTRQHGDDASEAKRLGHIKKCASTTSSTLGFRICGMQVYQVDSGKYVCHSKYYGRKLDGDGVHRTLCQFLHNGRRLRHELIDDIIQRLYRLNKMLMKQNTFRFYSSSLLVMYDGDDSVGARCNDSLGDEQTDAPPCGSDAVRPCCTTSDVRMIDFAHATHQGFLSDEMVHVGPDQGYLYGLQNLIHMFEDIKSAEQLSVPTAGDVA